MSITKIGDSSEKGLFAKKLASVLKNETCLLQKQKLNISPNKRDLSKKS